MAVDPQAFANPAPGDLRLDRRPMVTVASDLEHGAGQRLERIEQHLDPLVLLEPPEVEQRRLGRTLTRRERAQLDADVVDGDGVRPNPERLEVALSRVRDHY